MLLVVVPGYGPNDTVQLVPDPAVTVVPVWQVEQVMTSPTAMPVPELTVIVFPVKETIVIAVLVPGFRRTN